MCQIFSQFCESKEHQNIKRVLGLVVEMVNVQVEIYI
jgi:hypothetical protein